MCMIPLGQWKSGQHNGVSWLFLSLSASSGKEIRHWTLTATRISITAGRSMTTAPKENCTIILKEGIDPEKDTKDAGGCGVISTRYGLLLTFSNHFDPTFQIPLLQTRNPSQNIDVVHSYLYLIQIIPSGRISLVSIRLCCIRISIRRIYIAISSIPLSVPALRCRISTSTSTSSPLCIFS